MALKNQFPELFSIVRRNKEAKVSGHLLRKENGIWWDVQFVRNANDWELESFAIFLVTFMR